METEIELSEIWRIIRQRLALILSLTIVSVVVSGCISFFLLKPQYDATATLLIQSQKTGNQMQYSDIMTIQQLVKTYEQVIKSQRIAQDVINRLNITSSPTALLSEVQVKSDTGSLVTAITVTDRNPGRAVDLANGFAQSFADNINSIMKIDNVSILDQAKLAAKPTPVSPKPYLNMAISLVLGLMVGIGLAFLFEYLDKSIKTEHQVEEILDLPVLGVIAVFDNEKRKLKSKKKKNQVKVGGAIDLEGSKGQINLPI